MKTTIEVADDLLLRAKSLAKKRQTTLRTVVEEGIREVLAKDEAAESSPIEPVTFGGAGLRPEFQGKGWKAVENAIYPESSAS